MVDFSEKHVAILALYTFDLVVTDSQKTSFTKKQLTFKLYFCFISNLSAWTHNCVLSKPFMLSFDYCQTVFHTCVFFSCNACVMSYAVILYCDMWRYVATNF